MLIRNASVIKLKPGAAAEYKRRHDEIWPEMREGFAKGPIRNYSIWYYEEANLLFAYSEVDSEQVVEMNPHMREVVAKWQVYMSDIIEHVIDPATGKDISLPLMFLSE